MERKRLHSIGRIPPRGTFPNHQLGCNGRNPADFLFPDHGKECLYDGVAEQVAVPFYGGQAGGIVRCHGKFFTAYYGNLRRNLYAGFRESTECAECNIVVDSQHGTGMSLVLDQAAGSGITVCHIVVRQVDQIRTDGKS